jgi:hypothetical protein
MFGSWTVPQIDVNVSGTLQNVPGPELVANYVAANDEVASSLGRNLSGGARNITVNLIAPGTMFGDRSNVVSLRVGKTLTVGRYRTTASVDVFNVLNANTPLALNNNFAAWQAPLNVLSPRFAKVVLQLEF